MSINDSTTKCQYWIYTLTNPLNDEVFYVGMTKNPQNRLNAHTGNVKTEMNSAKREVMTCILESGHRPVLTIIDTLSTEIRSYALDVERLWIWEYLFRGAKLTNRERLNFGKYQNKTHLAEIERAKTYAEMTPQQRAEYDRARRAHIKSSSFEEVIEQFFSQFRK